MKITLSGNNTTSARALLDISQEALRETMLTDLKLGAANGEITFVRAMPSMMDEPQWFKVYIYKISDSNVFIDAQPVDEEVMKRCSKPLAGDVLTELLRVMPDANDTTASEMNVNE